MSWRRSTSPPDLILTSPPYDAIRTYGGHGFDFDRVADTLVGIMPEGGVLVWVVADATVDGSETGTSFRQALGFMERDLLLHDTMIYMKKGPPLTMPNTYIQVWEYMFVFTAGAINPPNLIKDKKNLMAGTLRTKTGIGRTKDKIHWAPGHYRR